MKPDIDILIRDYFNKKLDQNGVNEFERLYVEDSEFKALADQMESEILGIRKAARTELKTKFTKWEKEAEHSKWHFFKIIGVAASFCVAMGVALYYYADSTSTKEELFLAYYETYPNYEHTTVRDNVPDSLIVKYKAYAFYDQGEMKKSIEYFSDWLLLHPNDQVAVFFQGVALLESKNYDTALNNFKTVTTAKLDYYSDAAIWYSALIYIHQDNTQQAVDLLNKLRASQEYSEKAEQLIEELK